MRYRTPGGLMYAPYLLDLIEGNHTLIAGATGAGKSVLENAIIYGLLCTHYPGNAASGRGCQFVFIDPKLVELEIYRNLPHTWIYADNPDSIETALYNVRLLIDSRLREMKRRRLRTYDGAPVYVFIDELVDLVEARNSKNIMRILVDSISIARAAGVYYVIATQAPNRKILKPEIVLNMNCRVALRCNSPIESRQIIGTNGAEELPPHGLAIVQRNIEKYMIEIKMKSDADIQNLVSFWEKQHPIKNYFRRLKCRV